MLVSSSASSYIIRNCTAPTLLIPGADYAALSHVMAPCPCVPQIRKSAYLRDVLPLFEISIS